MKIKRHTDKDEFGLTQAEIALILGVNRSLYAHNEGKRRSLPSEARLRIAEMLFFMYSPEAAEALAKLKPDTTGLQQLLEKRLDEVEFRLLRLNHKINAMDKKVIKSKKAVVITQFLTSPADVKKAEKPEVLPSMEILANLNYKKIQLAWDVAQLDLELLQGQQQLLKKAIKRLG